MEPGFINQLGTIFFAAAIGHTFFAHPIHQLALKQKPGSLRHNFLHLFSEVELVFGIWATLLIAVFFITQGYQATSDFLGEIHFREPLFVFVIVALTSAEPIIELAEKIIITISEALPINTEVAFYLTALTVGPLLGSWITEPAAMTVTALILKEHFFEKNISLRTKYITIGILFVNVSIGGVLTPFAAPPILMVASKWNWDTSFLIRSLGWKAAIASLINALIGLYLCRKDWLNLPKLKKRTKEEHHKTPKWVTFGYLIALALIIYSSNDPAIFLIVFFIFEEVIVGIIHLSRLKKSTGKPVTTLGNQDTLKQFLIPLKYLPSTKIAIFLAGLVVLGHFQGWWVEPVLRHLSPLPLFLATAGLTSITDNAALTYLGAQIPNLSDSMRYSLASGAVAGGGMTLIANAPNPIGYATLRRYFGPQGIHFLKLATAAIIPTVIAMACLWLLPNL